jgi:putative hydrolase of the HAD superfamily
MIKSIIFDIGGVIVGDLSTPLIEYLSRKHKKQFGRLKSKWRLIEYQYRVGKMTENEFWEKYLKATGLNEKASDLKKMVRKRLNKKIKGTLDVAKELKKNYKLAILSNYTKEWVEYVIKKHRLKVLFDPRVVSCYEKCAKPDPKIYDALLKKLKLKSRECLFIDNREANDVTADNLGFNCIVFKNAEQLIHELRKLGLEVGKWKEKN